MAKDLRSSNVRDLDAITAAVGTEVIPAENAAGFDIKLTVDQIAARASGSGNFKFGPSPSGDTTGATDAAAIQAALTALTTTGGTLLLPAAISTNPLIVNATLQIPDFVTLAGQGSRTTYVKQATGAALPAVIAGEAWYNNRSAVGYGIQVEDLFVDGNKSGAGGGAGHGIAFTNFRSKISRCEVSSCLGYGILQTTNNRDASNTSNGSIESHIENNIVHDCDVAAIGTTGGANQVSDGWCVNNVAADSGIGLNMTQAAGWRISGNHVYLNVGVTIGTDAIFVNLGFGTRITDNYIENFGRTSVSGTYYAINVFGNPSGAGTTVSNNQIKNDDNGNAGSSYYMIQLFANSGATQWTCTGNIGVSTAGSPKLSGIKTSRAGAGTLAGTISANDYLQAGTGVPTNIGPGSTGLKITGNSWNTNVRTNASLPTGALAETGSGRLAGYSAALTPSTGVVYLSSIWLPAGLVVSSISYKSLGAASVPTNWWFGLYDLNYLQLALTADQLTAAWGAATLKTLAVATTAAGSVASFTTTYEGLYYLGFMQKATTPATIVGLTGSLNDLYLLTPYSHVSGDSAQSTPPAFPHTVGSITGPGTTMAYGFVS